MTDETMIKVEIAYALPDKQRLIELKVPAGTTAFEAAARSGITDSFPDLDLEAAPMGVFGQALGTKGTAAAKGYVLQDGDRVEIYRPLKADPKEARRKRAAKAQGTAED